MSPITRDTQTKICPPYGTWFCASPHIFIFLAGESSRKIVTHSHSFSLSDIEKVVGSLRALIHGVKSPSQGGMLDVK